VLAADPCRESVCRRLVELLLRAGDHVRAVKYYRRLKDSLNEILSIAPSEALDKLLR
jgi:DNA-binding SARP family transcriptional activator